MTMDKSLRIRRGLVRSRSVLTRAERIILLWQGTDDGSRAALPGAPGTFRLPVT